MSTHTRTMRLHKLAAGLSTIFALAGMGTEAFASVLPVTSCADDGSAGTLRAVAASAMTGDQIDLSQLSCVDSTISLTQGEVVIPHNATLVGSVDNVLTIANGGEDRVLRSASTDRPGTYLGIVNVNVSGGRFTTKAADASGGCIYVPGTLSLTNSTVSDCVATSTLAAARGGAIYAQALNMTSSRVTGSAAVAYNDYQVARGGGVYAMSLACTDSTLSGNDVVAATAWFDQGGGALVPGGNLDMLRCTVNSNAAGEGGGIMQFAFNDAQPHTVISNSTISGNSASLAAAGFEVFCPDCVPQPVQLMNSTVAFNIGGTFAAAGVQSNGAVIAQSSIIAKNANSLFGSRSANADLSATALTGANNLIMSTDAPHASGVIALSVDPQLQPLANNGGQTQVHALAASSPALSHGNNVAGFTTDQRGNGFNRCTAGATDIGSYQHQTTVSRKK